MSQSNSARFTDLIGPPVNAVPLRATEVRFQVSAPSAEAPPFVKSQPPNVSSPRVALKLDEDSQRDGLSFSGIASKFAEPFYFRQNTLSSTVVFLGLATFFVWMAYAAIPGLSEAMPMGSMSGVIYLSTVIPASLFASSVVLNVGAGIGWCLERAFNRSR